MNRCCIVSAVIRSLDAKTRDGMYKRMTVEKRDCTTEDDLGF